MSNRPGVSGPTSSNSAPAPDGNISCTLLNHINGDAYVPDGRVDKPKEGKYNNNLGMGANGFDGDSEAEAACRDSIHLVKRWTQVSAEAQPLAA